MAVAGLSIQGTSGQTVVKGVRVKGVTVAHPAPREGTTTKRYARHLLAILKADNRSDSILYGQTNLRVFFDGTEGDTTSRVSVLRELPREAIGEDTRRTVEDPSLQDGHVLQEVIEPFEVPDELLYLSVDEILSARLQELGLEPEGNRNLGIEGSPRRGAERI